MLPPARTLSVGRAWDLTYAFRDQPEVVYAAPMFRYLVPENAPGGPQGLWRRSTDDPATETDYEWSLLKANVLEAWSLFGARPPGAGVQVGHPIRAIPCIRNWPSPPVFCRSGYDYDDDDPDPVDDLTTTYSTIRAMARARAASS